MSDRSLPKAEAPDIIHREYTERFLKYFQDLVPNPGEAALDIQSLPTYWEVLSALARKFCFDARTLDKPVANHWGNRRDYADELLKQLVDVREAATKYLREHIWVETRIEVCGVRKDAVGTTPSTLNKDIREISSLLSDIDHLAARVRVVRQARKTKADDDSNFYLFLMAAFLKCRGATVEIAIFREIAHFVNAHFDAQKVNHRPLESSDIRTRIRRFRARNLAFAQKVEADVLGYVQRETTAGLINKEPT